MLRDGNEGRVGVSTVNVLEEVLACGVLDRSRVSASDPRGLPALIDKAIERGLLAEGLIVTPTGREVLHVVRMRVASDQAPQRD